MANPSELELKAYHEATHAVFCFEAGIGIEYIVMKAGNGYMAGIKHVDLTPWIRAAPEQDRQRMVEGALKMLFAAHQMALLIGETSMGTDFRDIENQNDIRREFPMDGETVKALMDDAKSKLADLSSPTRRAVEALAKRLIEVEDKLEGEEIRLIIAPFYTRPTESASLVV